MFELREREFYKKPSMVKKEMKNKAKARNYWKKIKLIEEDSRRNQEENINSLYLYISKLNTPFLLYGVTEYNNSIIVPNNYTKS